MLDHPDKTTKLLAELKAALPFEVELTEWLVKQLRHGSEAPHRVRPVIRWRPRWHRVPYRSAGKTRSTRYLPNSHPRAAVHAPCSRDCRLSEASGEETEEAGATLNQVSLARANGTARPIQDSTTPESGRRGRRPASLLRAKTRRRAPSKRHGQSGSVIIKLLAVRAEAPRFQRQRWCRRRARTQGTYFFRCLVHHSHSNRSARRLRGGRHLLELARGATS